MACISCKNPSWTWIDIYKKTNGIIKGKMCQPCEDGYLLAVSFANSETMKNRT